MSKPPQLLPLLWLLLTTTIIQAGTLPTPPNVAADSYLLLDYATGQVLVEQEADKQVEPASLTKLMTAYVVFDELKQGHIALDNSVQISEKAWRTGGSRTFVEVDTEVPVETLLKGMIIQSGNDASVALAEFVAGSEDSFADYMNRYAEQLGMSGSHFVNATGLPAADHYTTARDMALLASAIIRQFPEYYTWYSQRDYTYNSITQHNRNKLLWWDDRVDGMKTGYTEAAGYCLVSSANQDDMRLISVVMGTAGARDRARESQKLLNYGFRFYETRKLFVANEERARVAIWMGAQDDIGLGLARDLYISLPRGEHDKLQASMEINEPISAPVARDQVLGSLKLQLPDGSEIRRPLIALQTVPEGSLFERLSDSVRLWFE
ncbi:MAG: D-alanyl-D-alanine carboxypeptidase [Gammaproteobacteria bacterium]|nr:D-alanyl-D-alanine carboxypeptidase [Gammaproteobacteria bacterium]